MATIKDAYLQLGVRKFRSLVAEWLSVHENLDAPKVRVRRVGDSLSVYRRGTPLNLIDRVLDPQLSVPFGIDPAKLPHGTLYEVAYFHTSSPVICEYSEQVQGRIVILSSRSGDGAVPEYDHLDEAAAAMGFLPPPILLHGSVPGTSVVDAVLAAAKSSLRGELSPWSLMESVGVAPLFGSYEGKEFGGLTLIAGYDRPMRMRVADPLMESARAQELQSREHLDMNGIILCDFIDFFENELNISDAASTQEPALDARLLSTVSNIYMGYITSRSGVFDDVKISDRGFEVDKSLIREDVRDTFGKNGNNQRIFQMLLQSLYSPKKRPTGTITESILATLNRIRYVINSKISEGYETSVPTYEEYLLMTKK